MEALALNRLWATFALPLLLLCGCGGSSNGVTPVADSLNLQIDVLDSNAVATPVSNDRIVGEIVAYRDRQADGTDRIVLGLTNVSVDRAGFFRDVTFAVKDMGINVGDIFPIVDGSFSNAAPPASRLFITDLEESDPLGDNRYGWGLGSGNVRLVAFTGDTYTFELQNVRLRSTGYLATGEIAVSGTLTFSAPFDE